MIYLDDVLIFGRTFNEHLERVNTVLERFRDSGIKLSPKKCNFFQTKLNFLGHEISKEGIFPNKEKIDKVLNWKRPCTVGDLSSFLGFTNYYRRFVRGYETLTTPLEKLFINGDQNYKNKNKSKMLEWTEEAIKSFEKLKEKLVSPPILCFPSKDGEWILDTDASHTGMGAVLSQVQNGEERVVEYSSRKFTKSELRYCVTRKELLAVCTFLKQFRHYLLGRKFLVRTDHKALTWLLNWDKPSTSQYCKWRAEIEQFDFSIEHRQGKSHINADFLSRLDDCGQCQLKHEEPQKKRNVKVFALKNCERYNDVIYRYHSLLGHIGSSKLIDVLKKAGYNWEGLEKKVVDFCISCPECLERKDSPQGKHIQLKINSYKPFQKIMMDVTGPLPAESGGNRYILGIVDVFSRYISLIPLKSIDTKEIIQAFLTHWISIFGFPEVLISDNAPNFSSQLFQSFCNKFNILKEYSAPYYPQGNGIIERVFRTAKDMIYATCKQNGINWMQSLPYVNMGLRSSVTRSIGEAPHHVVFGRNFPLLWDQASTSKEFLVCQII